MKIPSRTKKMDINQDILLASKWIKLEEMTQIFEPFAHHTDMFQTGVSSLSVIWRRFGRLLQPDIVNFNFKFNPVPVATCLMDPTVGSCLLAPKMSGLLQTAKLCVIQHALTEAQLVTNNSQSSTASSSTSLVSIPVLQFLTAKMTNIMSRTPEVHRSNSSWTSTVHDGVTVIQRCQWQGVLDGVSGCVSQSCTTGPGPVVSTSI